MKTLEGKIDRLAKILSGNSIIVILILQARIVGASRYHS